MEMENISFSMVMIAIATIVICIYVFMQLRYSAQQLRVLRRIACYTVSLDKKILSQEEKDMLAMTSLMRPDPKGNGKMVYRKYKKAGDYMDEMQKISREYYGKKKS